MSDLGETVNTDGVGAEELVVDAPAPAADDSAALAAAAEAKKATIEPEKVEPTLQEKMQALADKKAAKATSKPKPDGVSSEETLAPAYTPNLKFTVLDKQQDIPKEFHSLIKDEKSEKMVRELFEKANGLDHVKTKAAEVRTERDNLSNENTQIKQSIDGLKSIYQGAASSGDWLKLDDFFARLKIPTEHVLQYALAKVRLAELPPEQQQTILARQEAERNVEEARQQATASTTQMQQARADMMRMQLDYTMAKPDVKSIADAFDAQTGKPGSFKQQVINMGNLTWTQSNGTVDLTPEQAAQKVISEFGLKAPAAAATAPASASTPAGEPAKKVIVRETTTIPNIQGGSSSPLKKSPRSIEDLRELAKHAQ